MKTYVILCETMHRAERLCSQTAKVLGPEMRYFRKYPMFNIETRDDVALYFTNEEYWFGRGGRRGRRHFTMLYEGYFERMLDTFERSKNESV